MPKNIPTTNAADTKDIKQELSAALDKISEHEKTIERLKKEIMVLNQKSWLSEQCGDDLWDK